MRKPAHLKTLSPCADALDGPLGVALQAMGTILARRLDARGQAFSDLSDAELVALFLSAFQEAAPIAYPNIDPEVVAHIVARMRVQISIDMAANADGGDALH